MASAMDSSAYRVWRTSRGHSYSYFFSPPAPGRHTLLFVHGFPSTSRDWRHQVAYFVPRGYGVVVPDMLGYGGSDHPSDAREYGMAAMAQDVVEIVDHESLQQVVAVGHDWGSEVVSRLSIHHSPRFRGFAWLAVGYASSASDFDLDKVANYFKETYGREVYGYMRFFIAPDAALIIKQHADSFIDVFYPADAANGLTWMCPAGKIRQWVEADLRTGRAPYLSEEDALRIRTMINDDMSTALKWYLAYVGSVNHEDNRRIIPSMFAIRKPVFFGAALRDPVCIPDFWKAHMASATQHQPTLLTTVDFDAGHWLQMERAGEVNAALESWIGSLGAV